MRLNVGFCAFSHALVGIDIFIQKITDPRNKTVQFLQHVIQSCPYQNLAVVFQRIVQNRFNRAIDIYQKFDDLTINHAD